MSTVNEKRIESHRIASGYSSTEATKRIPPNNFSSGASKTNLYSSCVWPGQYHAKFILQQVDISSVTLFLAPECRTSPPASQSCLPQGNGGRRSPSHVCKCRTTAKWRQSRTMTGTRYGRLHHSLWRKRGPLSESGMSLPSMSCRYLR